MSEREELINVITERFDRVEDRLDKQRNRQTTVLVAVFGLLLSILGGAYTIIDKRMESLENQYQEVRTLQYDVGSIDGALKIRFPESAVFGTARDRYINMRGND